MEPKFNIPREDHLRHGKVLDDEPAPGYVSIKNVYTGEVFGVLNGGLETGDKVEYEPQGGVVPGTTIPKAEVTRKGWSHTH